MMHTAIRFAIACLTAAPHLATAQNHLTPNPPCIIAHANGEYEIKLSAHNEPAHNEEVPVYWKTADGSLRSEKSYEGMSSDGLGRHSARIPLYLARGTDGTWFVEEGMWVVFHGPPGRWRAEIPNSGRVHVRDLSVPSPPRPEPIQSLQARGGVNIIYTYDDTGEPGGFDAVDQLLVRGTIYRAVSTINELLADDYAPALVQFVWEDFSAVPGMENTLALADVTVESRSVNTVINALEALYTSNDTDPYETALQVNSPRPNVAYKSNLSDSNATSTVWLSSIQRMKLFQGIQPTQVIKINSARTDFDLDPYDGITAGQYDLTGALIHELIHLLGFVSFTEGATMNGPITQWDTFRLNASDSLISPTEFFGNDRELRSSQAAVGVLQLNSSFQLHRLSQGPAAAGGDARQASHWRDDFFDGNYIGIMDPTAPTGRDYSSLTVSGTYFTIADIRALDVMGYDIDESDFTPFPTIAEPVLSFPVADAVLDPALDVAFSWNAGNEIEADLLVYDLGTTIATTLSEPVLVYRESGITNGSTTATAAAIGLQPGHRYQWSIGAWYALGFATSQPETFIAACYADRNGDGVINFFDMTDFLTDFNATDPSTDLAEPYGVWNFFDVAAYQALFNAGCP